MVISNYPLFFTIVPKLFKLKAKPIMIFNVGYVIIIIGSLNE